TGADGILELRVQGPEINGQKSVLFQAKMGTPADSRALEQALILSNWREAAVFFAYGENSITVYPIDAVVRGQGNTAFPRGRSFRDFFNGSFLVCTIGDSDLAYDARRRILKWRDSNGGTVGVQFTIPHRIRVSIKNPWVG